MTSPIQQKILDALVMALRPLARALMRVGIGYREFSEMAKSAFVHVAAEDYGLRGRTTNSSRIAIMTGITRKEVKQIRDRGPGALSDEFVRESPASIVLEKWHSDPNYSDSNGRARVLAYDRGEHSFFRLVSSFAGDVPAGAMRKELERIGAIEVSGDRSVKAIKSYYLPDGVDDRLLVNLQEVLATAASTIAFNSDPSRVAGIDTRFMSVSSVDGIDQEFFPEINQHARKQLVALGEEFYKYLAEYKAKSTAESSNHCQVGIGLYYYELGTED